MTTHAPDTQVQPRRPGHLASGVGRQTVEFLVALSIGILLFRTFAAEAYIVPTGSMAPTLLGLHEEVLCPNCHISFALGVDEEGRSGRPICPNCGQAELDGLPAIECNGDRLLVQKFLFEFRAPRRWEVAVFHFPADPSQAYVKRVVGLPGESIQLVDGDVFVNGRVARKTLSEQRAMRLLVHDSRYVGSDANRFPRFFFRRGTLRDPSPSGWRREASQLVHDASGSPSDPIDWVEYRHWDPDRGRYAPIHDFNSYNGDDVRGENRIRDLMVEARVDVGPDVDSINLRLDSGGDRFLISLPAAVAGVPRVFRNGRALKLAREGVPIPAMGDVSGRHTLEASVMDCRLTVALDGKRLFDRIDYDDPRLSPGTSEAPVGLGVRRGTLKVERLRIYRDVYYTGAVASALKRPFAVDSPYQLGDDEFFVLGDNSPVSNDSRFWSQSPAVPGSLLLGKPFLVHFPGQVVPLHVFGRSFYWVPDPREIRYIR